MFDGPLNPPEKKLPLVGAKPVVSTTSAIVVASSFPFLLHHHSHHIASYSRKNRYSYYGHVKPSKVVPYYQSLLHLEIASNDFYKWKTLLDYARPIKNIFLSTVRIIDFFFKKLIN